MRLGEENVEFARRHITRFYDTDFFPKHFSFDAIWHNWEDAKKLLIGKDISDIPLSTPIAIPWPKPRGGYRMVHQPDPLSSLVYAAITHSVAKAVEEDRESIDLRIACSYRIALSDGSFFESGTGYSIFRESTDHLCKKYKHVLLTDITDFYNQIYVHRVRNAISSADEKFEQHGREIEELLLRWNTRTSQGIPVGPASSIIMSEAVLIDVDRFIKEKGFAHTRYVDDFRIFSNSKAELQSMLRKLTAYLYEVHRLNLSGEKTKLLTTESFIKDTLHNHYELEKVEIFEQVRVVINPYSQEEEQEPDEFEESREQAIETLQGLMSRVLALPTVDLGLARAVIRKAKGLGIDELIPMVLENTPKLMPVINDVFLYLAEIGPYQAPGLVSHLEKLVGSEFADEPAFRIWAEWLITDDPAYVKSTPLKNYVMNGEALLAKAKIAVIEGNISWVREQRARYGDLSPSHKLAVIFSSPVLAKDEREPWLRSIRKAGSGATLMESWFAKAALDGAIDHGFASSDLSF